MSWPEAWLLTNHYVKTLFRWNAAVSKSTPLQTYLVALATSDFEANQTPWRPAHDSYGVAFLNLQSDALQKNYDRLDPQSCIARYINPLQATQSLILVLSNTTSSDPHAHSSTSYDGTTLISENVYQQTSSLNWYLGANWICKPQWEFEQLSYSQWPDCRVTKLSPWLMVYNDPIDISRNYRPVSHCLSQGLPTAGGCEVQFNIIVLIVVTIMNAIKVVCILMLFFQRSKITIALIGDAIQHFLQHGDDRTKKMCLLSQADVLKKRHLDNDVDLRWVDNKARLSRAATSGRWAVALTS